MTGYDRWKTTPPEEPDECSECGGVGYVLDDELERHACPLCGGSGVEPEPDPEPEPEPPDPWDPPWWRS